MGIGSRLCCDVFRDHRAWHYSSCKVTLGSLRSAEASQSDASPHGCSERTSAPCLRPDLGVKRVASFSNGEMGACWCLGFED